MYSRRMLEQQPRRNSRNAFHPTAHTGVEEHAVGSREELFVVLRWSSLAETKERRERNFMLL